MHITPESRLHFQTTCFLHHHLYRYVIPNFTVSVIATDFRASQRICFFLSSSAYPRKECVCKPLSQFIFLDTRIIPFGISVYLGQGETLPTQRKSWQPVEFDFTSVFQPSFPHFRPWHPHLLLDNMPECSCCATGNLYLINQACSIDDAALKHRLWI